MAHAVPKFERVCKKCGGPCLVTASAIKEHMIWCSPCRQKQPGHWPEFGAWKALILRCTKPTDKRWHDYGGRGIKVCDRWLNSYQAFLEDMGRRPTNLHSIDRIDNNGNYEPSNCRWATREEQYANRRNSKFLTIFGERMTQKEASLRFGVDESTISSRLSRGWSAEEAVRPAQRKVA